jgi:hypothetical protein
MTIKEGMLIALQSLRPLPRNLAEYEEQLTDQLRQLREFKKRAGQSDGQRLGRHELH